MGSSTLPGSAEFWSFKPPPEGLILGSWRGWFSAHGIDPDAVAFVGVPGVCPYTWVERRDNPGQRQIVYLTPGVRDDLPIVREVTIDLAEPPAPFPEH